MIKNFKLVFLACIISKLVFGQDYFIDSIPKKPMWGYAFNLPTTRGRLYSTGVEREQIINNSLSFTSAIGVAFMPLLGHPVGSRAVIFVGYFQPFNLLVGKKKLKFETGPTVFYYDSDITNNPNAIKLSPPGNEVFRTCFASFFIGGRFVSVKKKFSIHLGYMPKYDLRFNEFYPFGLELGTVFKFSK